MTSLYQKALLKADEVRLQLGLTIYEPFNIFDACLTLGLSVRFVDVDMEGLYIKRGNGSHPTIFISNQRPLPRRFFTCGHELGHHVFAHGFKLNVLKNQQASIASRDYDELLVDSFAGALLMPAAGIYAEFAKRDSIAQNASAIDFYKISSVFGTGYETLIVHCKTNAIINSAKAAELLKFTPGKLLKSIFKPIVSNTHFKIIDIIVPLSKIDLEVSNYIILPQNVRVDGDHLQKHQETILGTAYYALKPGIVTAVDGDNICLIRIQQENYIGLAENRHLENLTD